MSASWIRINAQKSEKLRKSDTSVRSWHLHSANMLSEIPKSVNQTVNHPELCLMISNQSTRARWTAWSHTGV
jgi:hypothetical protein